MYGIFVGAVIFVLDASENTEYEGRETVVMQDDSSVDDIPSYHPFEYHVMLSAAVSEVLMRKEHVEQRVKFSCSIHNNYYICSLSPYIGIAGAEPEWQICTGFL